PPPSDYGCGYWLIFIPTAILSAIIPLGLIFILRKLRGDRIFIEINRKTFQIHRSFLFFNFIFKGETRYLTLSKKQEKLNLLTLLYHDIYPKQYEFGSWLRQGERDWLQAELTEFFDDIAK
ncbi:MAG: hypothetical protein AAGA60_15175, partial [Cyanobacteria bacterium P01_E01_bin.42]